VSFDLAIAGGSVADVRGGTVHRAAVAIDGDRIAALGPDDVIAAGARRVLDAGGRVLVPGYIEPHTHIALAAPWEFASAVLPHGTTTAFVDALPLISLADPDRLPDLLERLALLPVRIRWLIRLHPQSFEETDRFHLAHLRRLWRLPSAGAVGEVTRWMDVLLGDPDLREKIAAAAADGRRVEGHAAGASLRRLVALREAGFTSCHEAITAPEVTHRLQAGLRAMLRHSSIRPDLPELLGAVMDRPDWQDEVMLTLDGPTPRFIEKHGYLDHLMRLALGRGLAPMVVLRMVTRNPADYFGCHDLGVIEPGARADVNVLESMDDPTPVAVLARGRLVVDRGRLLAPISPVSMTDALPPVRVPRLPRHLLVEEGRRGPGLRLVNDVITEIAAAEDGPPDLVNAALLDRGGRWITRSWVSRFVDRLGGLATSFTSGFDIAVLGQNPRDMEAALAVLAEDGGGIVIVENGEVRFRLGFDLGVWSSRPWRDIVDANNRLAALLAERGYRFRDPVYSLLFLTFDSLPSVRLTSRGIWDVRARRVLAPAEPLTAGAR
jgi:adenine deaminase